MSQVISERSSSPKVQAAAANQAGGPGLEGEIVAQEVTAFSPNEILVQSGVAMLGQGHRSPSLPLTLL